MKENFLTSGPKKYLLIIAWRYTKARALKLLFYKSKPDQSQINLGHIWIETYYETYLLGQSSLCLIWDTLGLSNLHLLPFHPVLDLDRGVSRREIPSGIKFHWPSNNKSSMSAEPDVVQVVRDYARVNNEIIKMRDIALSIVEATKVCGYYLCLAQCFPWPLLLPDAHHNLHA